MTVARASTVELDLDKYHHCVSECAEGVYLYGKDKLGKECSHRRQWVIELLGELHSIFSIDIHSYLVLDNRYHLILKADRERAYSWSNSEVDCKWKLLQVTTSNSLTDLSREKATRRERLCSINCFIQVLNDSIANRARKEGFHEGTFWKRHFKLRALVDDASLLAHIPKSKLKARC